MLASNWASDGGAAARWPSSAGRGVLGVAQVAEGRGGRARHPAGEAAVAGAPARLPASRLDEPGTQPREVVVVLGSSGRSVPARAGTAASTAP